MLAQGLGQRAAMLLAAAASADRGILPLLRAVLGPDELYALVNVALLGSYANDLVRTRTPAGCNQILRRASVNRWSGGTERMAHGNCTQMGHCLITGIGAA